MSERKKAESAPGQGRPQQSKSKGNAKQLPQPLTLDQRFLAEHADAIRALAKNVVHDIIKIGELLTDAKELAGHGNWLPWLEREFRWSDETARRFMRVHELSKSHNLLNLEMDVSALYLLAAPSTPELAREEIIKQASAGKPVSVADVKQAIDEAKPKRPNKPKSEKPPVATELDDQLSLFTYHFPATSADMLPPKPSKASDWDRDSPEPAEKPSVATEASTSAQLDEQLSLLPAVYDEERFTPVDTARNGSKEQRMQEVERYMKALDLDIHDWVSTMTIGKEKTPRLDNIEDLRRRMVELMRPLTKDERRREINEIMSALKMSIHDLFTTMTIGKRRQIGTPNGHDRPLAGGRNGSNHLAGTVTS